jgi:hypothetical protein
VVGSLSQPTDDVVAAFTAAQSMLETTWQKQDEANRIRQEETAKALLHIEQRNLLAQHIGAEFKLRMEKVEVPNSVKVFLCGPWAQVLAERKISGAAADKRFDELADNLLWSAQTQRAKKNPARLVQIVPEMVRTLREAMRSIEYPDEMTAEFFEELIALHEAALEGVVRKSADKSLDEPAPIKPASTTKPLHDEFFVADREGAESGFVDTRAPDGEANETIDSGPQFDPLPVGSWVDMQVEDKSVRANLRWSSPYQNLFMFVTGDGTQHSMTRKNVDRMRAQGGLRVVSLGGVVSAALDRVADKALKNSAKHGQTPT